MHGETHAMRFLIPNEYSQPKGWNHSLFMGFRKPWGRKHAIMNSPKEAGLPLRYLVLYYYSVLIAKLLQIVHKFAQILLFPFYTGISYPLRKIDFLPFLGYSIPNCCMATFAFQRGSSGINSFYEREREIKHPLAGDRREGGAASVPEHR